MSRVLQVIQGLIVLLAVLQVEANLLHAEVHSDHAECEICWTAGSVANPVLPQASFNLLSPQPGYLISDYRQQIICLPPNFTRYVRGPPA